MLALKHEDQLQLLAIRRTPGYEILLDIMEKFCVLAETELLKQKPWTEEVQGYHAVAHAQRAYFERVQKEVEQQIGEGLTQMEAKSKVEDADEGPSDAEILGLG
jgi:hypothetical protein